MSSSSLPEGGAKLTLDLSEWESNWSSAIDQATELQSTIDDLGGSVDIDINFTGDDALPFDEVPEAIDTELNVTEDKDTKGILDGINFLATVEKIKIAIDVVGTAINFVKDIGSMVVNPFLDVEDAVAKINAQTGGTGIADLGQFIRDIQAADLGENVDQISDVVIAAKQLNAPIEEAATAALTFTHTFKDEDPTTVLTTLNTLVQTGLVPNLQAAADLMTVAFQQGVNKGNDALQVVNANAQSWSDMGLNGTQALSAINSLQDAGVDSATDAAKMIQTLDDALTAAAANADSPQAEALKTLGMTNPKDSGSAMGADFVDGFASSFSNLPADQQDLISGVLFGKGGKKFTGALEGLTTQGGPFGDVVGAAADAATEIDNSLRGAIDDFVTEANAKLAELLSSDSIDLPGKIKALKDGLQEGIDVLAKGGTVGDALEVALNIPGLSKTLDTFIGNFERIVGNIEIAFLQIVASIQDITGHGKEAAGTRQTIADLSTKQLSFDLKLANADEVPAMINQALSRGLDVNTINNSIGKALDETLASGDFGQHINILDGMIKNNLAQGVDSSGEFSREFIGQLQDQANNALAAGNIDLLDKIIAIPSDTKLPGLDDAVAGIKKQVSDAFAPAAGEANAVNPFTSAFAGINTSFTDAFPGMAGGKTGATGGSVLGNLVDSVNEGVSQITEGSDTAGLAFDHIATTADTMATGVTTALDTVNTGFDTTAAEAALMDQGISLSLTDNTVTASFEAVATAANASFPGVIAWFERTTQAAAVLDVQVSGHIAHLLGLLHDLQFLSAQVSTGVQAALTLGAGLPGGNTTTNNVTVNNNVNSQASAAINGYAIGRSLRGG